MTAKIYTFPTVRTVAPALPVSVLSHEVSENWTLVDAACGKRRVAIGVSKRGSVTLAMAWTAGSRSYGKDFPSFAAASKAYKSPEMKAILAHVAAMVAA